MARSIHFHPPARLINVPSEPESDILTAESVAVQVIQENSDLAGKYAAGDLAVLSTLQEKALQIAAGRVKPAELENTLMRKLGASY